MRAGAVLIAPMIALFACSVMAAPQPAKLRNDGVILVAKKKTTRAKTKKKETTSKKTKSKETPTPAVRSTYAEMPSAQRAGIQFDLAWVGYYNGLIDGDFSDKSIDAVKVWQKDRQANQTGVLDAQQRASLAAISKGKQEQVGWRMADDKATGARLGLPATRVSHVSAAPRGTRWSSAQGQIQIETFRIREPGATLATVFERQKQQPANRRVALAVMRDDYFILAGTQGLKKFYVRAQIRDLEIRGITILYDQATEGIMDPVTVVMSSAFAPFPGTGLEALIGPPQRRAVEYGTGIVVSRSGHIITDSQLTKGCNVIEIGGHGDAVRTAENAAPGIALLRIFGAHDLTPAPLVHVGAHVSALTLAGIADPAAQNGKHAVSTEGATLTNGGLQPPPPLGFSGAAALGGEGRFFGMVRLKTPVLARADTAGAALPQATVVPVATIRRFLDMQYVTPSTGRPGTEAIEPALVRVICVRR